MYQNGLKKLSYFFLIGICLFCITACGKTGGNTANKEAVTSKKAAEKSSQENGGSLESTSEAAVAEKPKTLEDFLDASGKTLESRIKVPEGYQRIPVKKGSFGAFLRTYKMKKDGSPVLLYDGTEKGNQEAHVAIFRLPLENEDLQQCADSVMRVYGEYYYKKGEYGKIAFSLGSSAGLLISSVFYKIGGYPLPFFVAGFSSFFAFYLALQINDKNMKKDDEEKKDDDYNYLKYLKNPEIYSILIGFIVVMINITYFTPCLTNHLNNNYSISVSMTRLYGKNSENNNM